MIEKISFLKERKDKIVISHEPRVYPDFKCNKGKGKHQSWRWKMERNGSKGDCSRFGGFAKTIKVIW